MRKAVSVAGRSILHPNRRRAGIGHFKHCFKGYAIIPAHCHNLVINAVSQLFPAGGQIAERDQRRERVVGKTEADPVAVALIFSRLGAAIVSAIVQNQYNLCVDERNAHLSSW
jgi:hypothetical protein